MRFKVEEKHLQRGRKVSHDACPLALVIGDKTGLYVSVCAITIQLWDDTGMVWKCLTPWQLVEFINRFDRDKAVELIEFELDCDEVVEVIHAR